MTTESKINSDPLRWALHQGFKEETQYISWYEVEESLKSQGEPALQGVICEAGSDYGILRWKGVDFDFLFSSNSLHLMQLIYMESITGDLIQELDRMKSLKETQL